MKCPCNKLENSKLTGRNHHHAINYFTFCKYKSKLEINSHMQRQFRRLSLLLNSRKSLVHTRVPFIPTLWRQHMHDWRVSLTLESTCLNSRIVANFAFAPSSLTQKANWREAVQRPNEQAGPHSQGLERPCHSFFIHQISNKFVPGQRDCLHEKHFL